MPKKKKQPFDRVKGKPLKLLLKKHAGLRGVLTELRLRISVNGVLTAPRKKYCL
jgi:hypothetical protein